METLSQHKQVLFVSHDSGRTGAPIILLDFLRWFKENGGSPFHVLLKKGGELEPDFSSLSPVSLFTKRSPGNGNIGFFPGSSRVGRWSEGLHRKKLRQKLAGMEIGLVYSNTVTNGQILDFLSFLQCPVITHVHELEYWIHRMGPENLEQVKRQTDHYIAVSEAVKENLVNNHHIPEKTISVVKGFVPRPAPDKDPETGRRIRQSLGIPEKAFVVGGSGAENWRKGKDLFVQTALCVTRNFDGREIHFLWVGGPAEGAGLYELLHDVRHAGLSERVHFVGQVPNPADYYDQFDIFTMTSREDPFPLVNLEVAYLGKPILCFENAGGTPEFVEDDAGFVVPYLDVEAMADKIVLLATHEQMRMNCALAAVRKVKEHHDVSIGSERILKVMDKVLQEA